MRAESDQRSLLTEPLTAKLPDIQLLADDAHFGIAGVADVRVMRPYDGFRIWPACFQKMPQRLEHVGIAQVPRIGAAIIHDAIIALGRFDQSRVLSCIEKTLAVL